MARSKYFFLAALFVLIITINCEKDDDETSSLTQGEWILVESSEWDGDRIVLTPDEGGTVGGAYYTASFDLGIDFDIRFKIYFGDKDDEGADGIVFVIGTANMAAEAGEGIGYQGIVSSIGVEMDTYPNDGEHLGGDLSDPLADHLAVDVDGSADHAGSDRPLVELSNIEDGQEHDLRVRWTAADGSLRVFFDDMSTPKIEYSEPFIDENLGGQSLARVGFTAATGALSNLQYIVPVEFSSNRE